MRELVLDERQPAVYRLRLCAAATTTRVPEEHDNGCGGDDRGECAQARVGVVVTHAHAVVRGRDVEGVLRTARKCRLAHLEIQRVCLHDPDSLGLEPRQ